jgi:hypothetical protein
MFIGLSSEVSQWIILQIVSADEQKLPRIEPSIQPRKLAPPQRRGEDELVDIPVLLKLADFLQKRTTGSAKFCCVFLQASQDAHIALLQNCLAKPVHIRLAGAIPSLPNVVLR